MDIHEMIGKLPRPKEGFVLHDHKYTGPYNPLHEQLDENDRPVPGQEPFNAVDAISMRHDICYRDHPTKAGKRKCDDGMLKELEAMTPANKREKADRVVVQSVIAAKKRLGMGIDWSDELANELHKPIRKKFKKRRVYASGVDSIWAADLVDMQAFSRSNKGYKYILMIIDVFSKYGWAIPLKTKTGIEVEKAFADLWKKQKPPKKLWTDKGTEFYNKPLSALLKKKKVEIYSTENEEKSSIVERWNRTIKRIMWKYFTANNTKEYVNVLNNIIHKYNNTYHRSIKCTPTAARESSNYRHVYKSLYPTIISKVGKPKFEVGDRVRIVRKKNTFEKGFTPNWTEELFTVVSVKNTSPATYTIADTKGESIKGTFYEQELQKTNQEVYRIEKVVKKRTRNGIQEVYVKWKGYGNEFNSWIPITDLES